MNSRLALASITAALTLLSAVTVAQAKPVKLVPESHLQFEFAPEFPEGLAVAPKGTGDEGNIYVGDNGSNRVQELTSSGAFVLMFGKDVNETTGGDICTAEEIAVQHDKCKNGARGETAGEFKGIGSLAVDGKGNVYVLDYGNSRIEEYTAAGQFVLMFGKEVNVTKDKTPGASEAEKNICTAISGNLCGAGVRSATGSTEHGAFKFGGEYFSLLAVGGPEGLLYAGDEGRVQEFDSTGAWRGEIEVPGCTVGAVTVDSSGNVYAGCYGIGQDEHVIKVFGPESKEINEFEVTPTVAGTEVTIHGMGFDREGHLAVAASEVGYFNGNQFSKQFGSLFDGATGLLLTRFTIDKGVSGVAFNSEDDFYALGISNEIVIYKPVPVAELKALLPSCVEGPVVETNARWDCTLQGEANPWGVGGTEVWFEWGRTSALGSDTLAQPVTDGEAPVGVSAEVPVVRPNETAFFYRLAGYDDNVRPPEEALASGTLSFQTPIARPWVGSEPSASFVKASSAVLFDKLNPENAKTEYFFEYAPGNMLAECPLGLRATAAKSETCPGVEATTPENSRVYGEMATTQQATGLQPSTSYRYRLFAESENQTKTEKLDSVGALEGEFTTKPAPSVGAVTGTHSAVTATSERIAGAVDPGGAPATYMFEVGVYAGADTQYGIVFSGPVGASSAPVAEELALTGLQPGTAYAYRIAISSGYATSASHTVYGEPATFTTAGVAEVLPVSAAPTILAGPSFVFPKEPVSVTPRKLTRAQELARALKACAHRAKSKRAVCKRDARKKYTTGKARGGK